LSATPDDTEQELLSRTAAGDQDAFTRLYRSYAQRIYEVAMTYLRDENDAAEGVQEIFIRVWNNRDKLSTVSDFRSWLFIIARNSIYDHFREQKAESRRRATLGQETATVEDTDFRVRDSQYQALLQQAIQLMPDRRRMIYTYSRQQGLNTAEIASRMGISRFTVKNQLKAANHFIRDYFRDHLEILLIGALLLHH
jgi:RNA polymerase sigma-70 factor (family 1)